MSKIEEKVISKIRARSAAGRKKYGTTMERDDLQLVDWLQHAQEEAMDLAVYLEKIMEIMEEVSNTLSKSRVVRRSEQLKCKCKTPTFTRTVDADFNFMCGKCGRTL